MTLARIPILLALLLPASALAQDGTETVAAASPTVENLSGPVPGELESLQEIKQRFTSRMAEFTQEARAIVDQTELQERERIKNAYAGPQDQLDGREGDLRVDATAQLEAFLDRHPMSSHAPHVMFRLAELYFEQAEEDWQVAASEYSRLEAMAYEDETVELAAMPLKDYSRPIALYQEIIDNHSGYEFIDGTWYMLGYCFYDELSGLRDEDAAREAFETLVSRYGDSDFAVDGNMRLGEFHFDYNEIEEAIPYYERVVDAGSEHRLYDKGLYKLAWSYYKLSEYDQALTLFTSLLDFSEEVFLQSGEDSPVAPEALEYMAISFSDVADYEGSSPVKVSERWFQKVGERSYEPDIIERLADVLTQQAFYEKAIEAYEYYQVRWPLAPENPSFQQKVAQLYMSLPIPDPDSSQAAQTALTERYNEGTPWWNANRNNPDALAVASNFIEQSLAAVAVDYHILARETGKPADFSEAADRYKEYLSKFPFADDYYEIQWYMADTLYNAERFEEAQAEYRQLLKAGSHNYEDGARWQLAQVARRILTERYGRVEALPQDAVVEKTVETKDGKDRPVYMLTADHESFIEATDAIKDATFQDPDFAPALVENRAAFHYLAAQVYYEFGHFEEARSRLEEIIRRFPEKDEAAFAASLVVGSYQAEGDLEKVRFTTGRFASMVLGSDPEVSAAKAQEFASLQEGAAFKLAFAYVEQEKRAEAAEAFLAFIAEFPNSDNVPLAMFNAANNLDLIGKKAQANELFEQYINTWPRDDRSKTLYYRIASNYAEILELDRAIEYYERLYRFFPDYVDASSAIYMAGFLRTGVGDHETAAKNYEAYVDRYPDKEDVEDVAWLAGEQWEIVGDRQALRYYEGYLEDFSGENPSHTLEAIHWLANYYQGRDDRRRAERYWGQLIDSFVSLGGAEEIGPTGRHIAAEAAFRGLMDDFETFKVLKLTGNQTKDADILVEGKKNELIALEQRALALVQTYQDFEFSSASLYLVGAAYLAYSDMLFNAEPPADFTQEMIDIYEGQLAELAQPLQEKAIARLRANLDKATKEGRSSEWIDKTIALLHEIEPSSYPLEKSEVRGSTNSVYLPSGDPMAARPGAADESEEESSEEPSEEPSEPPPEEAPEPDSGEVEQPETGTPDGGEE